MVVSSQPECFAAHDAGERFDAVVVGDHAHGVVERVGLAVERQQLSRRLRAAHDEIALDLGGVEHMQRPAAVVGDEVGDVDERIDRAQADRASRRFCSQSGDGPFLTPRTSRSAKAGQSGWRLAEVELAPRPGRGIRPSTGFGVRSLNVPMSAAARSRAMPLTPVQSGRFGVRLISITGSSRPAYVA